MGKNGTSNGSVCNSGNTTSSRQATSHSDVENPPDITVKYHANGKTVSARGRMVDGNPEGYWEWFRVDGTLKRSGHFENGEPVGEWVTYDLLGKPYKVTRKPGG